MENQDEFKVEPFDHKPYSMDVKSGRITGYREYAVHASREHMLFEEPPGSGLLYKSDGQPTEDTHRKLILKKRESELRAEAEKKIRAQVDAETAKLLGAKKEGK